MIRDMTLRAIVHATELEAKVLEALGSIAPGAKIKETHMTGYHGNEILVIEAFCEEDCTLAENLMVRDGIFEEVLRKPELHIEDGIVYLKIDKQVLYTQKKLVSAGSGSDAISIRVRVGNRNESREKTVSRIKDFLRSVRQ